MTRLSDRVPLPPRDSMNIGLSPCRETTILHKLGKPGPLGRDCAPATGPFKVRVRERVNVGPFKVTGLDFALESLAQIFQEVKAADATLFSQVKNEGMLCVRARRHNPAHFSNHSWGTAIDIFFGTEVVGQGVQLAHRGNLMLMPFFNRHGWYWGAGFSGDSVDSMHFELSEETILKMPDEPLADEVAAAPRPRSARAKA